MFARLLAVCVLVAAPYALAQEVDAGTPQEFESPEAVVESANAPAPDAGVASSDAEATMPSAERKPVRVTTAVAPVAVKGTARTDGSSVFALGARVGYGLPFGAWTGTVGDDVSGQLTEVYSGIYPLQAEATYRFTQRLAVGGFLQLAPAALQYSCVGGWCGARDFRAGALLVFRPDPALTWSPFVVTELGYEASDFSADAEDGSFHMDVSYRGFGGALVLGADHPIRDKLRLGFYFTARAGSFFWLSVRMRRDGFETIPRPSLHGFLGFGARAEYALF